MNTPRMDEKTRDPWSSLQDVLAGCAITAFICGLVVWLPILAGG